MSRFAEHPSSLPAVDERLVAPESRYEVEDGRIRYVAPADEPHGTRHSKLSALLEAHVAEGFEVASDMLTRTSEQDDVAPDASVFPVARDSVTGGRQLEQLAFEVASTETLAHAGHKACKLASRGVRRVFVIDVQRQRALEWSEQLDTWSTLDLQGVIDDPCLAVALPISALVSAAKVDDAIAAALIGKKNRVIEQRLEQATLEGETRGEARGEAKGRAKSLLALLTARRLPLTAEQRRRIEAERSVETLDRWFSRAVSCDTVAELFD